MKYSKVLEQINNALGYTQVPNNGLASTLALKYTEFDSIQNLILVVKVRQTDKDNQEI